MEVPRQQLEDLLQQLLGRDAARDADSIGRAQHILYGQLSTPENTPHLIQGLIGILRQAASPEVCLHFALPSHRFQTSHHLFLHPGEP